MKNLVLAVYLIVFSSFSWSKTVEQPHIDLSLVKLKSKSEQPIEVDIKGVLKLVDGETRKAESLSANGDGTQLVWLAGKRKEKVPSGRSFGNWRSYKDQSGKWSSAKHVVRQSFNFAYSISIGAGDKELITIGSTNGLKKKIKIVDQKSKEIYKLDHDDFEITEGSPYLKHGQISPDGKWLTFYTGDIPEIRGVMVYNFETKVTYRLQAIDDKHPTWSSDGSKILVHFQKGGNSSIKLDLPLEHAYMAYYDLEIDGNELVSWNRTSLDDTETDVFNYQKHPALTVDGKYLFYHSKKNPNAESHLHVRKLEKGSTQYRLNLFTADGRELKKVKHVAMAKKVNELFVVGKVKKDKDNKDEQRFDHIYNISAKDLEKALSNIFDK
ncbi:MAG: hypothetical protein HOE90_17915 [Bacteriovoracaceae bacterium]|jgi:hypothetical protein|nr:hypothetical protein [Bacteriovoracaceae bacterium]